MIPKYRMPHN